MGSEPLPPYRLRFDVLGRGWGALADGGRSPVHPGRENPRSWGEKAGIWFGGVGLRGIKAEGVEPPSSKSMSWLPGRIVGPRE